MEATITCPACRQTYGFEPEYAGKLVRCACGHTLQLPALATAQAPARHAHMPPPAPLQPGRRPPPMPRAVTTPPPSAPPSHRAGNWLIVGLLAFGLISCLGGAILLIYYSSHSRLTPPNRPPATAITAAPPAVPATPPTPPTPARPPGPELPGPGAGARLLPPGGGLLCPVRGIPRVAVSVHQAPPASCRVYVTFLSEEQRASLTFPINLDNSPLPGLGTRMTAREISALGLGLPPNAAYVVIINLGPQPTTIQYEITPLE
jgi:hypothetical protein